MPNEGYFIPPTIFTDVKPTARIAREEIFGPVLSVIKVRDLDEALEVANGTDYALTAGFFSRSPANIERVKAELVAGNVYINRSCTGAVVGRHPFGGFKMSGGGTKAGGRRLPAAIPPSADRDRKHHAPRLRAGRDAALSRRVSR